MPGIILSRVDRVWAWIYPFFTRSFGPRSYWSLPVRLLYVAVFEFIMLFAILLCALIVINLFRSLPYTRRVWKRMRADWTQLSFLLHGGLAISMPLAFEEYRNDHAWQAMAWICLAPGAWLYLRARRRKQRILALTCGAIGAMWIVALAKWVLIPLQKWPTGYPVSPSEVTRWVETGSAMVSSVWILIMLLAPALLDLLPRAQNPTVPPGGEPVTA